jgi:hypothetical protein
MNPAIESAPFLIDDGDVPDFQIAVAEIARTRYTETAVRDRLGLADITDLKWKALPIYRAERLAERDAQALAMELFFLQGAVPASELDRFLSAPSQAVLLRTGILAIDASGLARARASLFPIGDRLIFSDHAWHKLPHPGYTIVPRDLVMFVGSDSRWLARATVRRPVRAALDLCTGSGIQALLAAPHSERVLAVDINPRAACCARFNAAISCAANLEVATGDLFEPVSPTDRFDLITANPPFVSSPVDELMFRDGGPSGEAIQQRIVAGLPRHLAPGGIAQIVTELGEREGEPIVQRVRQWLDGAPMDIHILRLRSYSAGYYAIGHADSDGGYGAYLESVGAWARNLREQGYVRVISVLIAFEWSDPAAGAPWDRVDESQPPKREAGSEVEAVFSLERIARRNRDSAPDGRRVSRSGPIALTESRVLGSEQILATARATLLGQALTVEYPLNPVERDILQSLDKPVAASDLLAVADKCNVDKSAVLAAIDSLQRHGLVSVI